MAKVPEYIMRALDDEWISFCIQAIGRIKTVEEDHGVYTYLADLKPADTGKIHGPDDDPEEVEYRKYKGFRDRYEREKLLDHNARVCKLYSEAVSSMQSYSSLDDRDPFAEEPSKRWEHLCYGKGIRGKTWIWPWYKDCPNCGGRNPALGIYRKPVPWVEADRPGYWVHICINHHGKHYVHNSNEFCGGCGVERPQTRAGS